MTATSDLATADLVDLIPFEDEGEPFAHIVRPEENGNPDDMSGQDIVDAARLAGSEVVALCGHRFVPRANPDKPPACVPCFEAAGRIMRDEQW